ncbi:MAG: GTPase ObgE [Candidatus Moranbacteria bacterium]|nr:GTPase ObgE [Candidatus Moranbacteria bacterium]
MFTDEARIRISAGRGGNGVVAFDKIKMSLGPTGGCGGDGGDIYFEGVTNLSALNKYRHKRDYYASDGSNGKSDKSDGISGKDFILTVPIGSVIHNLDTKKDIDIKEAGQRILVAKGGKGGRGNFYFRSSTNTSPQEKEEGKPGQEFNLFIELRLIASIGLVGLPSAGKSSLLNELTATDVKVGAYHFTTLEPNLGSMDGTIIADIPGLIEGASEGKGLGMKFLRHIQRTKVLAHCISSEAENPEEDYRIIRGELEKFNPDLIKKKEIIILTKTDLLDEESLKGKTKELKSINPDMIAVSIHDFDAIERLKSYLVEELARVE